MSGVENAYTNFECKNCPLKSVQYRDETGDARDEACMCIAGYHARVGAYYRCHSYTGNPDGNPRVPDVFTCDPCIPGRGEFCPGGVFKRKKNRGTEDYFYVEDSSSVSGYRIKSDFQIFGGKDEDYEYVHAPKARCQIYGQSVIDNTCACPTGSQLDLKFAWKDEYYAGNVWNYHVVGIFTQDANSDKNFYFGYCKCLPGYHRDYQKNFWDPCKPCIKGNYCTYSCVDGVCTTVNATCPDGWQTAGVGSSNVNQCNVCPDTCRPGTFCGWRGFYIESQVYREACRPCPAGHMCPTGQGRPIPCPPGTHQPEEGKAACISCSPGNFSSMEGATSCQRCMAGKFSSVIPEGAPITGCNNCFPGKYSDSMGMPQCTACSGAAVYQPEYGKTSCEKCPPGYQNNTDLSTNADLGFRILSDVCSMCEAGKYSSGVARACEPCPKGTFNNYSGSTACSMCLGSTTTVAEGARSRDECKCVDGTFNVGNGVCTPCGVCMHNEYIVSECSATGSNVRCAVCEACSYVGYYALPQSMCNGQKKDARSDCSICTQESSCSLQTGSGRSGFYTLFKCYSGNISVDTTMCIGRNTYIDPLVFECTAGQYQDPFSQAGRQYSFEGDVSLNRNNTYLADVSVSTGSFKIYKTEDPLSPLQVARNSSTLGNAWPVIHVMPSVANKYPVSYRVFVDGVQVSLEDAPSKDVASSVDVVTISSGVWSYDGTSFFVAWMDGTISKAVVHPQASFVSKEFVLDF
jgi:hypothetical protein